jgi:hypothetical protein
LQVALAVQLALVLVVEALGVTGLVPELQVAVLVLNLLYL